METVKGRRPLFPLCQLVEDTKISPSNVPHHLLETQTYTKLKSNSAIHAEPSALHFSGFKLGKDYQRTLHRLVPGLSYTVKVHFCPKEWRYFYDCIRVHCKGEENLQVPVHAYPIIDDLHIPTHITIPAVPLGQSVSHVIPLSCSCPIDFEFQVYIIQPHKAFSVQPLSGVIPANGKVEVTVTFRPFQYDTSQVTLQVVISQFNSKPYVCTLCGSSSPHLPLRAGVSTYGPRADQAP
ncbi:cilia- and flagella-associated protein 221-like [Coregonus clupeaformis]|uniref:cilia- and flagella-associated protein 221-like n=1 Tax=Coregonus clupeaformis TaxID=59861 RepID=UPI001E1C3D59|nr:cilia- and flagella-associated protein 221-like [Coregonus clupeaformis]